MPGHDLIVIGASAGGVEALTTVVRQLPPDLPAAVLVVLHVPPHTQSELPRILSAAGPLPAMHAVQGMPIESQRIVIAPPDFHMLVEVNYLQLVQGPKEHHVRPAVDPLFRTAARAYGPRVLGVVLTGMLDDGTAGLLAIKRHGGLAVVQNPVEAAFPEMPQIALEFVDVDYSLSIHTMGQVLHELALAPVAEQGADAMASTRDLEATIPAMDPEAVDESETLGAPVALTCPDCNGVLVAFYEGGLLRFRCQVGHGFSPKSLLASHTEMVDRALWDGFSRLDEQVTLMHHLADDARHRKADVAVQRFERQLCQLTERREQMRRVLLRTADPAPRDAPDPGSAHA
jgi:two-component system chemotaxis response regulator CheB